VCSSDLGQGRQTRQVSFLAGLVIFEWNTELDEEDQNTESNEKIDARDRKTMA